MKLHFTKTCLFVSILFSSLAFFSQHASADKFSVPAKHAIAVEVNTGKILYEQEAQTPVSIASITNLLTAYLTYEAVENGNLTLDTTVPISDYPFELTISPVSNVNLDAREYTVRDLLKASLNTSANSATIALAEAVSGNESAFVDKMKNKLQDWGIKRATLVNATGLNNIYLGDNRYPDSKESDENQMSARDVAFIARRLILDYPEVLDITSQYSYDFAGTSYYNTNQMLEDGLYFREGVDGLKTGTSENGEASFVATTQKNHMRIITVVLHANDGELYPENRFLATNDLMDYVYQTFTMTPLVNKGKPYKGSKVAVFNGQEPISKAVSKNDLLVVTKKGMVPAVRTDFTVAKKTVDAPLKKGTTLGELAIVDKDLIGQGYLEKNHQVITMVAEKDISKAIWPLSWWNQFVRYVNENL